MLKKDDSNHFLGSTARWTAAVRAMESMREDRLFNDPWAAVLAGGEGREWLAKRPADSSLPIVVRTRYFDDFLLLTSARNQIRQIILMAAGLDTRAFRLNWPAGTTLFELDRPEVLNDKEEILGSLGVHPTCERVGIRADLTQSWGDILTKSGFNPQELSCWLLEGFLFYLPNEAILRIIDEVSSLAAPGSWLGFDIINSAMLTSSWTRPWIDMQSQSGAPWIGTLDEPEETLASRGWNASLTQAGQPDASFGRWSLPVFPIKAPDMPHNWFVTAQKE